MFCKPSDLAYNWDYQVPASLEQKLLLNIL